MIQYVVGCVTKIMDTARQTYGVNPVIFLALLVGCSPFFYFSIYRLLKAAEKKLRRQTGFWGSVFLLSTATPYVYVMIFGRNLPVWVYGVLVLLVAQGVLSLIRKLRAAKRRKKDEQTNVG